MQRYPQFTNQSKKKIVSEFLKMHTLLTEKKEIIIADYDRRADYKQVLTLRDYAPGEVE